MSDLMAWETAPEGCRARLGSKQQWHWAWPQNKNRTGAGEESNKDDECGQKVYEVMRLRKRMVRGTIIKKKKVATRQGVLGKNKTRRQ